MLKKPTPDRAQNIKPPHWEGQEPASASIPRLRTTFPRPAPVSAQHRPLRADPAQQADLVNRPQSAQTPKARRKAGSTFLKKPAFALQNRLFHHPCLRADRRLDDHHRRFRPLVGGQSPEGGERDGSCHAGIHGQEQGSSKTGNGSYGPCFRRAAAVQNQAWPG